MPAPTPRSRVTLKLATSLDGRIATASGESKWITGDEARAAGHRLRANHHAVLVGIGTALADDPELTVRIPDYTGPQPARIVLDSHQRLSPASKLAQTADKVPTLLMTVDAPKPLWKDSRVVVMRMPAKDGRPDILAILERLCDVGFDTVLVEGGGEVAAAFLRAGAVDIIEWFRAPILLGAEGRPAIGGLGLDALAAAPRYRRTSITALGDDVHERYERA